MDCRVFHSFLLEASSTAVTTIVSTIPSGAGEYGGYAAGKRMSSYLRRPGCGGAKRARRKGDAGALNNERRASGNISPDVFELSDETDRYEGTGERGGTSRLALLEGTDPGWLRGEDEILELPPVVGCGAPFAVTHLQRFQISRRVESGIVECSGPDFHLYDTPLTGPVKVFEL